MVNCVFMALNSNHAGVEYTFTVIYTLEATTKALARGLILQHFTYLRDAWNWLDFVVIGLAYLMFVVPSLGNLSALRSLRVLRTLKTVTAVPGLKTIVTALMEAVKQLRDVMILTLFVLSIFALIGLQLYRGSLLAKCILDFNATTSLLDEELLNSTSAKDLETIKSMFYNNQSNWKDPMEVCIIDGPPTCGEGFTCAKSDHGNPNFNYTNFDNFGSALLCSFRLMTQDYWENLYQLVIKSNGLVHALYFVLVIFLGSFYLVNVILAIVAMSYDSINRQDQALQEEEKKEALIAEAAATPLNKSRQQSINQSAQHTTKLGKQLHGKLLSTMANKSNRFASRSVLSLEESLLSRPNKLPDPNVSLKVRHPSLVNLLSCKSPGKENSTIQPTAIMPPNSSSYEKTSAPSLGSPKQQKRCASAEEVAGKDALNMVNDEEVPVDVELGLDNASSVITLSRKEVFKQACLDCIRKASVFSCCPPCYQTVCQAVSFIVLDPFAELFVTICIVLNTICIAIDRPGETQSMKTFLKNCNYFFTGTFAVEATMKVMAMNPAIYFADGWNVFDFVNVLLSLVEIPMADVELSILRSFRLLRVLKLAKSWKTMNMLFAIIARTLGALGNLILVLAIIIFIFAVVGMQLFGENYKLFTDATLYPHMNGKIPRWNFCDFVHSFMIVFRVLCGEWIESMWDCMQVNGRICIPFFLLTMILANLVVLNLFLALLLSSFGSESLQRREDDSEDANKLQDAIDRLYRARVWVCMQVGQFVKSKYQWCHIKQRTEKQPKEKIENSEPDDFPSADSILRGQGESYSVDRWAAQRTPTHSKGVVMFPYQMNPPELQEVDLSNCDHPDDCFSVAVTAKLLSCGKYVIGWSKVMRLWNACRSFCFQVVNHKYFESFIILMIVLSSLTLALEDKYLPTKPTLKLVLEIMDKIFTVIFTLEMILKWFAMGLNKFFRDPWCWLDFVIVSIALVSLALNTLTANGAADISAFRAMRTLRALRPLRAVSRWEGMKIVVNALFQAIPSIFNVLLVCLVFWLIFSIMGMQLFGGKFFKCIDKSSGERLPAEVYPNKDVCQTHEKLFDNVSWSNSRINFDNVLNGYLALLQVATFKGWIEIMDDAVDITDENLQPKYNHSVHYYSFFVLFIVFGSFFTLNLFIGVIIDNFNVQKKKVGGSIEMFMTDDQKKYYKAMKKMSNTAPQKPIPKPTVCFSRIVFRLVQNQRFDMIIMTFILLNTFVMCIEHHNQTEDFKATLEFINKIFIIIFTLECTLKIIAQRWYYFKYPWNLFDFVIVVFSAVCWAMERVVENIPVSPTLIRVIRVFRIGRVLRLVKSARGIRTLLFSLIVSLPALVNIGILLVMVMFIYAMVGISFFGNVRHYAGIDETFNFETFPQAMIVLFQISTSAGWNEVLKGLMNEGPPYCEPEKGDCGNYLLAVAYLCSYLVASFLVIVNMYIAVILENFSQATEDVQEGLTQDDFDLFYEIWEAYDPTASGYIARDCISEFVDRIGQPLGISQPNRLQLALLDIAVYEGELVRSVDLLDVLTKRFLSQSKGGGQTDKDSVSDSVAPADQVVVKDIQLPEDAKVKVGSAAAPEERPVVSSTKERWKQERALRVIVAFLRQRRLLLTANSSSGSSSSSAEENEDCQEQLEQLRE